MMRKHANVSELSVGEAWVTILQTYWDGMLLPCSPRVIIPSEAPLWELLQPFTGPNIAINNTGPRQLLRRVSREGDILKNPAQECRKHLP